MLRIFPGVCHPRLPLLLAYAFLVAPAVGCVLGCSTQQFSLAKQGKTQEGEKTKLVSSTSLSSAPEASPATTANSQSDPDRPNVSRLQKPENEPPKRDGS